MQTHIAFLSTEQKARSNGIRVLEPPADTRQAVRGNLYAVIEIAANTPDQSQLIEQALSVIQRNYYSIKGTQTFVLTESLRGAMELFQSIAPSPEQSAAAVSTQRSRSTVSPPGILLFSLTGNRLMAVGSGPIIALVTTGSNVDVYPNYTPGVERPANMPIEIYRQELTRGGAFLLAGQRCLQHFTLRELASIVAYVTEDNLADVASALRSQAEPELLTGLIAVISPDDSDEQTRTSHSPATVSPPRRRGGLPAALSVPPPRRNIAQRLSGTQPDATEAAMGEEAAGQQGGRPTHAPDTDHSQGTGESFAQRVQTLARQAVAALGPLWAAAQRPSSTSVTTERDMVQSGSTARSQSQLDAESSASLPAARQRGVLDDRDVDERYERYDQAALEEDPFRSGVLSSPRDGAHYPDDRRSTDQSADAYDAIETADHGQGGGAAAVVATQEPLSSAAAWVEDAAPPSPSGQRSEERRSPLIAWQPPVAPKRATGARARLFALVALSILLLTVVIVASVTWVTGRNNVAEAERVLDMAEANFLSAQTALDVDDKATARLRLNEAQGLLNEATTLVGTRLERADTLGALIEQELAGLLQIRPLQALAAPLVQFPPEAQPQRVVVSDQDIYILDTGRQLVQHYEMDPTNNIVMNVDGDTVLAQGDSIDGATVGRMVDITWMPPVAGVDDKAYLLVLDGSNNLFRYDNRVEGASRLDLSGREELRTPTEILVYADRLYLADAGTNQIYRYGRGDFVTPPERWFGPQTQSNLSSLRAMAIDGDIWLLYEEGLLLRYRTGEQLQFSLESSFGQIAEPVDLAVGNQSNSLIYIADSAEDRILVFNKDGGYEHQLRAPEGDVLRNLRGIAVDDVAGTMYILTQSFLFNHPIPN